MHAAESLVPRLSGLEKRVGYCRGITPKAFSLGCWYMYSSHCIILVPQNPSQLSLSLVPRPLSAKRRDMLFFPSIGPFKNYPQITVYHPNSDNGHAFANIGWTGWIGSITG